MPFTPGQLVRTNAKGAAYYTDERQNLTGKVEYVSGSVVRVRYGKGAHDVCSMYNNCLEAAEPSQAEIDEAIASIMKSATWRTGL